LQTSGWVEGNMVDEYEMQASNGIVVSGAWWWPKGIVIR